MVSKSMSLNDGFLHFEYSSVAKLQVRLLSTAHLIDANKYIYLYLLTSSGAGLSFVRLSCTFKLTALNPELSYSLSWYWSLSSLRLCLNRLSHCIVSMSSSILSTTPSCLNGRFAFAALLLCWISKSNVCIMTQNWCQI